MRIAEKGIAPTSGAFPTVIRGKPGSFSPALLKMDDA
jgi:hypothetical protein